MGFGRCGQIGFPATLALLLAMSLPGTEAAESEPTPVSRFPIHLMNGKTGEAARRVLKDHTLFRERKSAFRSTSKVYDYLFKRLPLATDMLRVLEFGKYQIGHGPDGSYTIDSGTGVKGKFWILHDADGQKILYGEGGYSGWLIRNLGGRATVSVAYKPVQGKDGLVMKNHIMVFVKIDNVVVDFLVKALDWAIRIVVRSQVNQASSSTRKLAEAIAREPGKVYEKLRKSSVIPRPSLNEFRALFPGEDTAFSFPYRAPRAPRPATAHSWIGPGWAGENSARRR